MKSPSLRPTLVALVLLAVVAWLGCTGGIANAFDRATDLELLRVRAASPALTSAAVALTWLGSAYVTLGGAAAYAGWRWMRQDRARAAWVVAVIVGGRLLAEAIKVAVSRPRPDFAPYPVPVSSFSFPSGHATNSMLAYGALALAMAPPRHRPAVLTAAVILSIAVGLTRPYLGVHWPSDILAGWMLGGAVLVLAWSVRPDFERTAA